MPLPKWILDIDDASLRMEALEAQVNWEKVKAESEAEYDATVKAARKEQTEKVKAATDRLNAAKAKAKKVVDEIRKRAAPAPATRRGGYRR